MSSELFFWLSVAIVALCVAWLLRLLKLYSKYKKEDVDDNGHH